MGSANELTPQNSYTRVDQETVYYVQNLRGDVVSLASEEFVGEGENRQRVQGRILETVRYTAFGVPQVFRRLAADIADDQGTPLDHGQRTLANVGNSGVNDGDYNAFFAADGFFYQSNQGAAAIGASCDIADDAGEPLSNGMPVGGSSNSGVNEGDYNCFFNYFGDSRRVSTEQLYNSADPNSAGSTLYEYGELSFPENNNRIGYCGYWWDPHLQMYLVRNRWYTPREGRWLTPDPIGYAGGRNLYQYCENQPWLYTDPMGLFSVFGVEINPFDSDGWAAVGDFFRSNPSSVARGAAKGVATGVVVTLGIVAAANVWNPLGWIVGGAVAVYSVVSTIEVADQIAAGKVTQEDQAEIVGNMIGSIVGGFLGVSTIRARPRDFRAGLPKGMLDTLLRIAAESDTAPSSKSAANTCGEGNARGNGSRACPDEPQASSRGNQATNEPTKAASRPNAANEVGALREQAVADIVGGRRSGQRIKNDVGSTDVDVIGPNGELIQVGGPSKAHSTKTLDSWNQQLRVTKEHARLLGVRVMAYLTEGTLKSAIDLAIKELGSDNVKTFPEPQSGGSGPCQGAQ
ncbi:MAG: RHS repeat-associated core domain-containing protein [Phycisphaerales bacterium]|nr:RHS repeat-associated core domain-containing protein [Phycisphaerales bacterium]